ncbi:hypothetical protein Q4Q39_07960 [Flavivirga amylovorans]|uniref:Uncharacterized protein n=1 Tax=Flavivirga amylovorans TaxID=870486 RepID=A0ABT8X079_9FLAO|nr:hypothetical protein [Flavivirga amylovorans]MDO5987328.1 hypothetical protein [Flavivirga amylovorans]
MKEYKLEIFADYFQFHLHDEKYNPNFGNAWTEFTTKNLLAITDEGIAVGTRRNMDVKVLIKILDSEPVPKNNNKDSIFQINESDLLIISKKLVVMGCTEYFPEAKRIELENGIYRVRIYYCDLDKISKDELDGDDYYEIEIWKTNNKNIPTYNQLISLHKN